MAVALAYVESLWKPALEIGVFWFAYYVLFVYIKDSGMVQALKGVMFLIVLFFVSQTVELTAIRWILSHLFQISILGFLIVFQPELRRGLARIGQSPLFRLFVKEEKVADEIVKAVMAMSKKRVGSLLALEREVTLKPYAETGIPLDGVLTSELLLTVFAPNTPFHDGASIIQGDRVIAAACVLPLSESQKLAKSLGTRHRAGLGLSEQTDALVVVVSEETGIVTLMDRGRIVRDVGEEGLRQQLIEHYTPQSKGGSAKRRIPGARMGS